MKTEMQARIIWAILFMILSSAVPLHAENLITDGAATAGTLVQEEGIPIVLVMNGIEVNATLNNTLTAREFAKLLPYTITVYRATDDLCGSVSEELSTEKSERQIGWKIGEIGWFGGWFTILVDHEERFAKMPDIMIIGNVDVAYFDVLKSFTGRVEIMVKTAG